MFYMLLSFCRITDFIVWLCIHHLFFVLTWCLIRNSYSFTNTNETVHLLLGQFRCCMCFKIAPLWCLFEWLSFLCSCLRPVQDRNWQMKVFPAVVLSSSTLCAASAVVDWQLAWSPLSSNFRKSVADVTALLLPPVV